MNQRKEENTTEADFIIRSYTKAELAQLYCPGLNPVLALSDVNYNKYRHSFLKREVRLIVYYLGEP